MGTKLYEDHCLPPKYQKENDYPLSRSWISCQQDDSLSRYYKCYYRYKLVGTEISHWKIKVYKITGIKQANSGFVGDHADISINGTVRITIRPLLNIKQYFRKLLGFLSLWNVCVFLFLVSGSVLKWGFAGGVKNPNRSECNLLTRRNKLNLGSSMNETICWQYPYRVFIKFQGPPNYLVYCWHLHRN